MDVVLPAPSIRVFCASLVCASKVGKDLYIEFDPTKGLILRTLNDAKSAYICFRFLPHFFQRCTTPQDHHHHHHHHHAQQRQNQRKRRRDNYSSESPSSGTQQTSQTSTQNSQEQASKPFVCRVSLRALTPLVRPRKNELCLRIWSHYTGGTTSNSSNDCQGNQSQEENDGSRLCLSFEFQWQASNSDHAPLLKALHCIPVTPLSHSSAATASREDASDLKAHPSVLLRLLDPLKRTAEAALIVRADLERIHASSFHQSSSAGIHQETNNNAVLQANSDSLLKTETGLGCDDLKDFFFKQDRDEDEEELDMPPHVNQHVILVFPIKEAKAFLQFANSQQAHQHVHEQEDAVCDVFFHWGGKPISWHIQQTRAPTAIFSDHNNVNGVHPSSAWKAELILATLDHSLLGTTGMNVQTASRTSDVSSNQSHRRVST